MDGRRDDRHERTVPDMLVIQANGFACFAEIVAQLSRGHLLMHGGFIFTSTSWHRPYSQIRPLHNRRAFPYLEKDKREDLERSPPSKS